MDLSSLIFVAVVVAWAVYLVPMALRRHEEDASSRSVEGFSDRLRVLARRDAVSSTAAELVAAGRPVQQARDEEPAAPTPAPRAARSVDVPVDDAADVPADGPAAESTVRRRQSAAARRAAARRRRVFNLLLLAIVVVAALAIGKVADWVWLAAPVTLMVAWLVACRLMVKRERAARATPVRKRRTTLADEVVAAEDASQDTDDEVRDDTDEIPAVTAKVLDEPADATPATPVVDGWTPVPVPLPTYVAKAPAGRTVRTIDLDSTGVWSSGRNEADSQLAREADAQRAQADAAAADAEQRRATGS